MSLAISTLTTHSDGASAAAIQRYLRLDVPPGRLERETSYIGRLQRGFHQRTKHPAAGGRDASATLPPPPTRVPQQHWVLEESMPLFAHSAGVVDLSVDAANRTLTTRRVFPGANPQGRVEVYCLANTIDAMLEELAGPNPRVVSDSGVVDVTSDEWSFTKAIDRRWEEAKAARNRLSVLLVGVSEIARQVFAHVAERGALLDSFGAAVASEVDHLFGVCTAIVDAHTEFRESGVEDVLKATQQQLFDARVELRSKEREIHDLRGSLQQTEKLVKENDRLRAREAELDGFIARQTVRNARLLQEEAKCANNRLARLALTAGAILGEQASQDESVGVQDGKDATDGTTIIPFGERFLEKMVQCNMDAAFDDDFLRTSRNLMQCSFETMTLTDAVFRGVYYSGPKGAGKLSTLTRSAIDRVSDFIKRVELDVERRHVALQRNAAVTQGDGEAASETPPPAATGAATGDGATDAASPTMSSPLRATRAHFLLSKERAVELLQECVEAVEEVHCRIKAAAQELDISQLLDPYVAPEHPKEPCSLCGRVELDGDAKRIEQQLHETRAALAEREVAVQVLHEEAVIRSEQIESLHARLKSYIRETRAVGVNTDPGKIFDGSPPLEIKLNIVCSCSTSGHDSRGRTRRGGGAMAPHAPPHHSAAPHATPRSKRGVKGARGNARSTPPSRTTPSDHADNSLLTASNDLSQTMGVSMSSMAMAASMAMTSQGIAVEHAQTTATGARGDGPRAVAAEEETLEERALRQAALGHVRPLSWVLRHVVGIFAAKNKIDASNIADGSPPCTWRVACAQYFRASLGTKPLVDDAINSLTATVSQHAVEDPRLRLFWTCLIASEQGADDASLALVRITHTADDATPSYTPHSKVVDDDPRYPLAYVLDQALHAIHVTLYELPTAVIEQMVRSLVEASFIVAQPARPVKSSFLDSPLSALVPAANRSYRRVYRWQVQQLVWDTVSAQASSRSS